MANDPKTVIVERSNGGSMMAIIALLVIALVAIGAYVIIQKENHKDDTVAGAAEKIGDAAQDVGDAAQDAVKK